MKENLEKVNKNESDKNFENKSDDLSIDNIVNIAEDLKGKVALAQKQKEENLQKQLNNRETLILELKNNDELILKAQEAVDYFSSLDEANLDLLNDQDKEQLENLKETLVSLKEQRQTIKDKINAISNNSEVVGEIYNSALEEDKVFEARKQHEKIAEELSSEIDDLTKETEGLSGKREKQDDVYKEIGILKDSVYKLFNEAQKMAKNTYNQLGNIAMVSYSEDVTEKLNELRKEQGRFSGKDKAAIDFLINNKDKLQEVMKKKKEYEKLGEEFKKTKETLVEKYKGIINRANEADKNLPGSNNQMSFNLWQKMKNYGMEHKNCYYIIEDVISSRG